MKKILKEKDKYIIVHELNHGLLAECCICGYRHGGDTHKRITVQSARLQDEATGWVCLSCILGE